MHNAMRVRASCSLRSKGGSVRTTDYGSLQASLETSWLSPRSRYAYGCMHRDAAGAWRAWLHG